MTRSKISGLKIIIGGGTVTLVSIAPPKKTGEHFVVPGQSLDLTPAQARLLGLADEATLAEQLEEDSGE